MITLTVNQSDLAKKMYFGKIHCSSTGLLERILICRKFEIPYEILLDEGAIMYSLNWLFQKKSLEYLKTFSKTNICDKTGQESGYEVGLQTGCIYVFSSQRVDFKTCSDGTLVLTSHSSHAIFDTLKDLFDYGVY